MASEWHPEEPVHLLRLLRAGDTWGTHWVTNQGRSNQASTNNLTNRLREGSAPVYFATKSVNSVDVSALGNNGSGYTPAQGICLGIYTNSSGTVLLDVWDRDGDTAPLALIQHAGVIPVRLSGVRTPIYYSGQYVGLIFSADGFVPPNI